MTTSINMDERHVIFGTGPLGQSVMRALRDAGYSNIRMVNRSGKQGEIPAEVTVVGSNAYDADNVAQVTAGAAVVYQCAQPAYTQWPEKFPPLQRAIIDGTARNDAKLVIGDNLYMYGDTEGQPIHENLPYKPHGHKGRTRAQIATEALEAHTSGKLQVALVRGSDFYGEGVKDSILGEMAIGNAVAGKAAQFFGNIDLPHTQTYIGDFGKAMMLVGQRDAAMGDIWHVPNAPTMTTREIMQIVEEELGQTVKISVMPNLMFEVVSRIHPVLREFREMRYEFEKPYIVDSSKFVAAFGDIHTPLREGLRRTIAWYKAQHAVTT